MINNQEQYKKIMMIVLNAIGAGGAGATTKLLHNSRQVSQWLNLANSLNRGIFGTVFPFLSDNKKITILVELWKVLTNASYVITTLDVNTNKTIFSKVDNWDLAIANLIPFISFETSAIAGVLAGITTLVSMYATNEQSRVNKTLKLVTNSFNLLCPFSAVIGGLSLFWTPGLDSKMIAPIFATLDGVSGTANWLVNKLWNCHANGVDDSVVIENATLLINNEEFQVQCNGIIKDNDLLILTSASAVSSAN